MDREAVRGSREGRHLKSRQRVVVIIVVMSWSSSSSLLALDQSLRALSVNIVSV